MILHRNDGPRNLPAVQWQHHRFSSDWLCFCVCLCNPEETMERRMKCTWRGDDLMVKELLFQRLEDVSQLFLSSQSSSITIVPLSNAHDSKLFQQDWLFLQQVYSSQKSIKIQTEMGWMGILKMYQWMYYVAHIWEVNAPLKPRCICCKDIFRLWLLDSKLSSITNRRFLEQRIRVSGKSPLFYYYFSFISLDAMSMALGYREHANSEITCSPG